MNTEEVKELCLKAVHTYGREAQTYKLIEELSEFIQAIAKYKHRVSIGDADLIDESKIKMAEELADVLIMIEQFTLMFPEVSEKSGEWYLKKIQRLKVRLGGLDARG